jgi:Protein of unknown function (DUF4199)
MMLTPLIKGLITAVAMIGFNLLAYYSLPIESPLHFLIYAIYASGIVWTLIAYRNSTDYSGKFGDSFNIGFRCFIVAILLMVVYTFTFNKMHPEFAEEGAKLYKEQQLQIKNNSKTPDEIDADAIRYKNGYIMAIIYSTIFGYLIAGAVVTAVGSLIITRRK